MSIADKQLYLKPALDEMRKKWPDNRTVNIACHGHSVPSGYFATPYVDTFNSYPHLLHKALKERFPFAVINVITTAIGGEDSLSGSERFADKVLCHDIDVVTIDYSLNDRAIGLDAANTSWRKMIESSLKKNVKVILLTPSWDKTYFEQSDYWNLLIKHTQQVRKLADEYSVGLSDTFQAFQKYADMGGDITNLLSYNNHPNRKGHEIITNELTKWFIA